ncbi:TetR/AcrR family transcriptional regulator [Cytobacillus sp. Hz8]|uniref:TetR/AcrR family transcriptional regulator n=1 Tax=Cytobacillus sp. Hz8 TaxID=3347168 RepID=UPI0035D7E1BF
MKSCEEKECSKKELILNTTLELIQQEGFEGVTIRKIAAMANVNVALINYHFGSKDRLINAAIQVLVSSFKETFAILDNDSIEPRKRLKSFLIQYIDSYREYPFIVRKLVNQEPLLFESQIDFVNFLRAMGLKKMRHTIEEITGEKDPDKLTIMMSHLLGAVFLPILIEPMYQKVTGYSFSDRETQVEILLERYFAT